MRRTSALATALFVSTLFAQSNPDARQQAVPTDPPKPAPEKPKSTPPPMQTPQPLTATGLPERPLEQIPYTPSLDIPSMDRTADACTDFYQFACGGWIAGNPIPPDQASWSVYGKLTELNNQFLWGVLEDAAKPSPDRTASQQKIGDYFQACMDESTIESLGARPLQPLLDQIAALKGKRELAALLAGEHQRSYGSGWLFGFGSDQDYGDATQVIAYADAGGLGLPDRDYYSKSDKKSKELRAKYVTHVERMLGLIGESKAKAASDAKTVMRIETKLASASLTRVERRDPYKLYHKMSP